MKMSPRYGRRGANAIEFALTFPVFLLLVFGSLEYGWFYANRSTVAIATTNGCRLGQLEDPLTDDPEQTAYDYMNNAIAPLGKSCDDTDVNCSTAVTGNIPNQRLACGLSYEHDGMTGLIPIPTNVSASSIGRLEWQR